MRYLTLVFVFVGALVPSSHGQQQTENSAPGSAKVRLVVTTTFGQPVGRVLCIRRALGSSEEYRQMGESVNFERIPFGRYELEIQAANFSARRERVGIYQTE